MALAKTEYLGDHPMTIIPKSSVTRHLKVGPVKLCGGLDHEFIKIHVGHTEIEEFEEIDYDGQNLLVISFKDFKDDNGLHIPVELPHHFFEDYCLWAFERYCDENDIISTHTKYENWRVENKKELVNEFVFDNVHLWRIGKE